MTNDYVSLRGLQRSGKIFWAKSLPTLKKVVDEEIAGENRIGAVIIEAGERKRYLFSLAKVDEYVALIVAAGKAN